jgi:hypothetical protein
MNILLTGSYTFDQTGLTLTFPLVGVAPGGLVYVTRLNVLPDTLMPGMVPLDHGYWIINNYGINLEITSPSELILDEVGFVSASMQTSQNAFYYRGENADSGGWLPGSMENGMLNQGLCGRATYTNISNGFTQLGQVFAVRDSMLTGRPKVAIVHPSDTALTQRGGSSIALALRSPCKGLLLPHYMSSELQNIPSPVEGSVAYTTDLKRVACFDGTLWQLLNAEFFEAPVHSGLEEITGISLDGPGNTSAVLGLGTSAGVLVLSTFTEGTVVNIGFPKEGLFIYRSDLGRLAYYDGIDWVHLSVTTSPLPVNTDNAVQSLPGVGIGTGTKDPNAILHIMDTTRALSIPVVSTDNVLNPHAGVIVFDPSLRALCLFDGVGWKAVK